MSRHEDDAWSQPPEVEDRDLSDDVEPVAACSVCDGTGMISYIANQYSGAEIDAPCECKEPS